MTEKHHKWPVLSSSEVLQHSLPDDLWMVLFGKVYNATDLLPIHPGGAEVLIDCGGVDATEAFVDVGHSQDAVDMLVPYQVGVLEGAAFDVDPKKELSELKRRKAALRMNLNSTYEEGFYLTFTWLSKQILADEQPEIQRTRFMIIFFSTMALLAFAFIIFLQRQQWTRITA